MIEEGFKFFFILAITALLAGLIVYLIMRCKCRRLQDQLDESQQTNTTLRAESDGYRRDLEECIACKQALEAGSGHSVPLEDAHEVDTVDSAVDMGVATLAVDSNLSEKQQAELQRISERAQKLDFATIGTASAADKDDLKIIKGIGPFIETKLNALGIYTFKQIANFTPELEEEVNEAIEFFPGRVKRDNWVGQAAELAKTSNA